MDDPIAAALRVLASDDDSDPQGPGDFQDGGNPQAAASVDDAIAAALQVGPPRMDPR